jgi:hypothetical protein
VAVARLEQWHVRGDSQYARYGYLLWVEFCIPKDEVVGLLGAVGEWLITSSKAVAEKASYK